MKILVIEDDRRIAAFLERGLIAEGYQVSVEYDGRDGLERARTDEFDLVIVDRMLPYVDGLEVARLLNEEKRRAMILMLTAKDSLQDKVEGLKGGADDYLTKPFAFEELLARIVALGRRRPEPVADGNLQIGGLTLEPQSRRVSRDSRPITPHGPGIRAAALPDGQCRQGGEPPTAAEQRVGLWVRPRDQDRGRLRAVPAGQDRHRGIALADRDGAGRRLHDAEPTRRGVVH